MGETLEYNEEFGEDGDDDGGFDDRKREITTKSYSMTEVIDKEDNIVFGIIVCPEKRVPCRYYFYGSGFLTDGRFTVFYNKNHRCCNVGHDTKNAAIECGLNN